MQNSPLHRRKSDAQVRLEAKSTDETPIWLYGLALVAIVALVALL